IGFGNSNTQRKRCILAADLGEEPPVGKPIVLHDGIALIAGAGATHTRPNRAQRLGKSSGDVTRLVVNGPLRVDSLHDVFGANRHIRIGGFTVNVEANTFEVDAGSAVEQWAEFGL